MASTSTPAGEKRTAVSTSSDQPDPKKACTKKNESEGFLDMLGTEMVDLYVGQDDEKKHIRVHKALLRSKVPYFDKMFSGGFKEATQNSAEFPDDSPDAFDNLVKWIYTGSLEPYKWDLEAPEEDKDKSNVEDNDGEADEEDGEIPPTILGNWSIVDVYLLLDKLCLFNLRDQVMSGFIDESQKANIFPSHDLIADIYDRAPEGSGLRKFALFFFHYIMNGLDRDNNVLLAWDMKEVREELLKDGDLLLDYLKLVKEHDPLKPVGDPLEMPRCVFHHHGEDEPCSIGKAS